MVADSESAKLKLSGRCFRHVKDNTKSMQTTLTTNKQNQNQKKKNPKKTTHTHKSNNDGFSPLSDPFTKILLNVNK